MWSLYAEAGSLSKNTQPRRSLVSKGPRQLSASCHKTSHWWLILTRTQDLTGKIHTHTEEIGTITCNCYWKNITNANLLLPEISTAEFIFILGGYSKPPQYFSKMFTSALPTLPNTPTQNPRPQYRLALSQGYCLQMLTNPGHPHWRKLCLVQLESVSDGALALHLGTDLGPDNTE